MPIITQIVCDRCQAVKRKVNHWYALTTSEQEATFQPLDCADSETVPGFEKQYLCGQSCAIEALTQWMDHLHSPDESKMRSPADTVQPSSYPEAIGFFEQEKTLAESGHEALGRRR